MYRTILVPLDGSPFAEHALPVALALARRAGANLMLVTVATPLTEAYTQGVYISPVELEQEIIAQRRAYLEATAEKLRARADVRVSCIVEHGEVALSLCDLLDAGQADLVVLATHGRGAVARFWLGSVADEMVRRASRPLLLVRPGAGAADLDREPEMGRILVPLDGTKLAEQILEPTVAMAGLIPDSELVLVRAIRATSLVDYLPTDTPEIGREARSLAREVQSLQDRLRQEAERYLDEVAGRLRSRGLRVATQVVVEDRPAVAILDEAEARRAGLIALETHGRRGLSRLVLGSVADKVVRGAHVPVLVHRPMPA
jgi:nucleotide-binding universal stress UspA family protein